MSNQTVTDIRRAPRIVLGGLVLPTVTTVEVCPSQLTKECLMAGNDFSAQFEKISDKAKTATNTLRAAGDKTKDKLAADAAAAAEKATAAANRFKDEADGDREKVSSQWQDLRDKWQAHVAKVQKKRQRTPGTA
jgi:hypothetical protein